MTDVTDISGVGPAKAETLADEGYGSVKEIANADKDELAAVDGVGDDRALEFIVQAQDMVEDEEEAESEEDEGDSFDLKPADVSDEVEFEEENEEDGEAQDLMDEMEEVEDDGPKTYTVSVEFDTHFGYDVFHAAVMRRHENVYTGRQPAADALKKVIDGLDDFESVTYELDEQELNELHSAVLQQRTRYQGDNLIDHMDELKKIEQQINDQRDEYLF